LLNGYYYTYKSVRFTAGGTSALKLQLSALTTPGQVKVLVEQTLSIPADQQRLTLDGKRLMDDQPLAQQGAVRSAYLQLGPALEGGGPSRKPAQGKSGLGKMATASSSQDNRTLRVTRQMSQSQKNADKVRIDDTRIIYLTVALVNPKWCTAWGFITHLNQYVHLAYREMA
jgi:hypothetical protein